MGRFQIPQPSQGANNRGINLNTFLLSSKRTNESNESLSNDAAHFKGTARFVN